MGLKNNHQITKNTNFWMSLGHAKDGIKDLLTEERNFRFHSGVALLVILVGFLVRLERSNWLWLILAVFAVLIAEAVNTIIENVVDLVVGKHYNTIAKRIKDIAAGGVLLASFFALIVGCLIFIPMIESWFFK